MCDDSRKDSESVMVYNIHHAKWALEMMENAMKSKHCKHLQDYMKKKVPYILEFASDVVHHRDYDEMMLSRTAGMLAYCHFASIGDCLGWELERICSVPSIVGGPLPRDSFSVFADLDLEICHDVVQAGLWDTLPME